LWDQPCGEEEVENWFALQVIAFSQGQRREEDLLRALVDAVTGAREAAGTLGQELPGVATLLCHNLSRFNIFSCLAAFSQDHSCLGLSPLQMLLDARTQHCTDLPSAWQLVEFSSCSNAAPEATILVSQSVYIHPLTAPLFDHLPS
jgi:hypothetical protein